MNNTQQDIATIVNAFARASTRQDSTFRDGALFLHMSRVAQEKDSSEFRARDIANIVNALARVGVWDEALFRKMSTVVRGKSAADLPLRDAARIVCAFTLAQQREGSRLRDGSLFRHVSDISVVALARSDLGGASAADIAALAQVRPSHFTGPFASLKVLAVGCFRCWSWALGPCDCNSFQC